MWWILPSNGVNICTLVVRYDIPDFIRHFVFAAHGWTRLARPEAEYKVKTAIAFEKKKKKTLHYNAPFELTRKLHYFDFPESSCRAVRFLSHPLLFNMLVLKKRSVSLNGVLHHFLQRDPRPFASFPFLLKFDDAHVVSTQPMECRIGLSPTSEVGSIHYGFNTFSVCNSIENYTKPSKSSPSGSHSSEDCIVQGCTAQRKPCPGRSSSLGASSPGIIARRPKNYKLLEFGGPRPRFQGPQILCWQFRRPKLLG
ncbi:hypothetical protein MPH_07914 [Macrophomina phaseolina MS6]|uniref:Uncharacterized protein n=1 Tax=Macrophomina phaseolina (strain MS6) TaxID=1126212 RepID=K2RXC5_MACPH|nr:hypothetical protein MPH_07914 [Macrophomina phaseolina MS6]